jgi:DNA polymerase elongation subunit (family B)
VLREFSENFTNLRKCDSFSNSFYKLFINSLYGRLGMSTSDESTEVFFYKNKRSFTMTETSAGEGALIATFEDTKQLTGYVASNVAVAAAIAAKARIKLNRALLNIEQAGGRILYTDTDSIYAAFKKKMTNTRHGDVF